MATRAQHWLEFRTWCFRRKLKACPAHPWTIAAYLRLVDRKLGAVDARTALDAISREHVLKSMRTPMRHAIVERTLEMIERRGHVREQHAALFDENEALGQTPRPAPRPKKAPKPGRRVLSTEPRLKSRRPPSKIPSKG
jgi:hypothetical protein